MLQTLTIELTEADLIEAIKRYCEIEPGYFVDHVRLIGLFDTVLKKDSSARPHLEVELVASRKSGSE